MSEIDTQIKSIRGLARALGKSPSTIHGWLHHDDLPKGFPRSAPWHAGDVEVLREWAEKTLQEDRAEHRAKPLAIPKLAAPGQFTVTVNDLIANSPPWRLRAHIGESLFRQLSVDDLEYLSSALSETTVDAMREAAGEAGVMETGTAAYYAALLRGALTDTEQAVAFGDKLWRTCLIVLGMRFKGVAAWWKSMPGKANEEAPAPFFDQLEPLPHRQGDGK